MTDCTPKYVQHSSMDALAVAATDCAVQLEVNLTAICASDLADILGP